MRLYELTAAWTQIRAELEALSDVDSIESFAETLDGITNDIAEKAENIGVLVKELRADALAIREEEKALAERRRVVDAKADRMTEYLMGQLRAVGLDKVTGTRASVAITKNPPRVVIADLDALEAMPDVWKPYKRDESNVDKTALKNLIMLGEVPKEVAVIVQGESLRIK